VSRHVLDARAIAVSFGGHLVLDDVSVSVAAGSIVGVTGPSGCGKTTLLRVMAGLHKPASGVVYYNGSVVAQPGSIAMLAQHPRLVCNPRWTLGRIICEPAVIADRSADIDAIADRVGLDGQLLDRYPGQVSDGQLQRACLGRILVQRPDFVLCDEPTAMLDPIATGDVVTLLRRLVSDGAGMVLVRHDSAVVDALSDTVVMLSVDGRVR